MNVKAASLIASASTTVNAANATHFHVDSDGALKTDVQTVYAYIPQSDDQTATLTAFAPGQSTVGYSPVTCDIPVAGSDLSCRAFVGGIPYDIFHFLYYPSPLTPVEYFVTLDDSTTSTPPRDVSGSLVIVPV